MKGMGELNLSLVVNKVQRHVDLRESGGVIPRIFTSAVYECERRGIF
jgi:hypothetical protein